MPRLLAIFSLRICLGTLFICHKMVISRTLALLLLSPFVLATPDPATKYVPGECRYSWRGGCKEDLTNTHIQGISAELLDDIHLMSEYAAAAYADVNNNSSNTLISCSPEACPRIAKTQPEGNCPKVEAAKAYALMEFELTPKFDDDGTFPMHDQSTCRSVETPRLTRNSRLHRCRPHQRIYRSFIPRLPNLEQLGPRLQDPP